MSDRSRSGFQPVHRARYGGKWSVLVGLLLLVSAAEAASAKKYIDASFEITHWERFQRKGQWAYVTNAWEGRCIVGTNAWWLRDESSSNATKISYCDFTNIY